MPSLENKVDYTWKARKLIEGNIGLEKRPSPNEEHEAYLKHSSEWERSDSREAILSQVPELKKHKWIQSEKEGHDLDVEGILDWRKKHAGNYRQYIETTPEGNNFLVEDLTVKLKKGYHVRPTCETVKIPKEYGCRVYWRAETMENSDFTINGVPYSLLEATADCVLGILSSAVLYGDTISFAVYGDRKSEAMEAIKKIANTEEWKDE